MNLQFTKQQSISIYKNWKRLECCLNILNLDDSIVLIETNNQKIEIIDKVDFEKLYPMNNNITGIVTNNSIIKNRILYQLLKI